MESKKNFKFKEMFKELKNIMAISIWVLTAGLPFLLGKLYDFIISENQSQLGLFGIYGVFIISILIVFLCFCIVHYFYNKKNTEEVKSADNCEIDLSCCLQRCKELLIAENDLLKAMGIVDLHGLSKLESSLPVQEVWILSADLLNELNDDIFKKVVKENIKKGIKYTYFHSSRDGERLKAKKLKAKFNSTINCISIDDERYKLLFSFADIIIYDPFSEKTTIFLGMGTNKLMENALYIKLDDNTVAIVLETLIEEYQKPNKARL